METGPLWRQQSTTVTLSHKLTVECERVVSASVWFVSARVLHACTLARHENTRSVNCSYKQVRVKTRASATGNARECEWKRARVRVETHASASGNAWECEWKRVRMETSASGNEWEWKRARVERAWKQGFVWTRVNYSCVSYFIKPPRG